MSTALIVIFAIAAIVLFAVGIPRTRLVGSSGNRQRVTSRQRSWGWIPAGLAILVLLLTVVYSTSAKELAVVTSFGKPVATQTGSGPHLKMPWQKVTKVNETVYADTYDDNTKGASPSLQNIRIGDGTTASVVTTIRWHIDPSAAEYIYQTYRSDDPAESLRDAVVDTQFKSAIADVLGKFNPTATITGATFTPDYKALADQVTTEMDAKVKDADGTSLIAIDGISIAGVNYSQQTEDRINSIVAQAAKTQQAEQAITTAKMQAKANSILENSLKNSTAALVSKCLDGLINGDFAAPAGFSCYPGGGSSVVIPSAPAASK